MFQRTNDSYSAIWGGKYLMLTDGKRMTLINRHGSDSEKPKTLLIGRPFFPKGRPHGTITVSSTFVAKIENKNPAEPG